MADKFDNIIDGLFSDDPKNDAQKKNTEQKITGQKPTPEQKVADQQKKDKKKKKKAKKKKSAQSTRNTKELVDALVNRTPKSRDVNLSDLQSVKPIEPPKEIIKTKIQQTAPNISETKESFKGSGTISLNALVSETNPKTDTPQIKDTNTAVPPPRIIENKEPTYKISTDSNSEDNQTTNIPTPTIKDAESDRSKYENTSSLDLSGNAKFDSNAYNQYSAAVDEIMNYIPNWLIRWGNTVILAIVGTILLGAYLIKYPDVIKGQATMTSMNPPVRVVSKSQGDIKLFNQENDLVNSGDVIAVIEQDASYDDIQYLKTILEKDINSNRRGIISELSSRPLRLGAIQQAFSNFYGKIQNSIVQGNEYETNTDRISKFNEQMDLTKSLINEQRKQIASIEEEYMLAQSVVKERYQPMYANGSISREQLERKVEDVNNKYNRLQEAKKRMSEYDKNIIDIQSRIANTKFSNSKITNDLQGNMTDAQARLNNSILNWEHTYVIKAPTTGVINYNTFLKDYTYVRREQELASIVPQAISGLDSIYAEVMLDANGAGKLELGQNVFIELDAYPKKQFGRLEGVLKNVSEMVSKGESEKGTSYYYRAEVALPKGFTSTTGKEIFYKPNMPGKAEVITKDVRLIQRLFNEIYNAFDY